jgi:hypothetical protein
MTSSATSVDLPLLQVVAFLGNVPEAARWFKPVAPSAPPWLTLAVVDLQQLRRTSCSKRKVRLLNRDDIWHLLPFIFVKSAVSLLILIGSIRLLPHALSLSITFFHVLAIMDLLHPIARVCSKSFCLKLVEICR